MVMRCSTELAFTCLLSHVGAVHGLLSRLHESVAERLGRAYAPRSKGPLQSAVRMLARFARAVPERELFRPSRFNGDREASSHNEWTFILLIEYMLQYISSKTGKPLSSGTIESYVSLLKGYLHFKYDFEVRDDAPRLTRLIKLVKAEDPLGGVRRLRKGFRRRHLRKLWRSVPSVQQQTGAAATRVAALSTAWHVLARGGEICTPQATRADLQFGSSGGSRHAVLWLRPLKKKGGTLLPKIPQYIAEADGGGSDTYMLLKRMIELDPVEPALQASTPLFRLQSGAGRYRAMTVAQLRKFTQDCAVSIGYPVRSQWGAHSGRIGGATDLAATGKSSQLLLQAKGRWASDIGKIYARMTRRCQLAASRLMQKARGRDLEDIHPGFVQTA